MAGQSTSLPNQAKMAALKVARVEADVMSNAVVVRMFCLVCIYRRICSYIMVMLV
jgi:hypothetical protein